MFKMFKYYALHLMYFEVQEIKYWQYKTTNYLIIVKFIKLSLTKNCMQLVFHF